MKTRKNDQNMSPQTKATTRNSYELQIRFSFFPLFSEQTKQKVGQDMINSDNHFKIHN